MSGTAPPTTPTHDNNGTDSLHVAETDGGDSQLEIDWKRVDSSLTPPKPPGGKSLSVSEVERQMEIDGYGEYVNEGDCDRGERRIVYYLYGRELGKDLPADKRYEKIQSFIANAGTIARMNAILPFVGSASSPLPNERIQENRQLWRKMQEVVLRYEVHYSSPSGGTIFERFCCIDAHKRGSSCTTIFRGDEVPYIQCLQTSSTCYIGAVITLVSYILTDDPSTPTGKVELIDASRYIRYRFSNDDLEKRVVFNAGGSSIDVLRDLVGSYDKADFRKTYLVDGDSYLSRMILKETSRYVVELLTEHGPALVSRFDMNPIRRLRRDNPDPVDASGVIYMPSFDVVGGNDVINYTKLGKYDEDPEILATIAVIEAANQTAGANDDASNHVAGVSASPSPPSHPVVPSVADERATTQPAHHAMVLVGCRFDKKTKKHWFLLQNSWRTLPLLEVSDAFMARHLDDCLMFVLPDVSAAGLGSVLSTHSRLYQECGFDDGGDTRTGPLEDSNRGESTGPYR